MVSDTVSDFYQALFEGSLDPGDERLAAAVDSASMSELKNEHMIDEIEQYEDVVACLTDEERNDLLLGEVEAVGVSRHPGAQVNTDPGMWAREVTIGNSTFLLTNARADSYHPVFGVR
jgi:CRISPR-associated endonuclease/helicase Cas3/CRISPR-associated endonuclease Cas3-HD